MRFEMRDSHQLRIGDDDGYEAEENGRKSFRLRRIVFAVVVVVLLVALFSSRRAVEDGDKKRGVLLESRDSAPLEDAGKKMGGSLVAGVRSNIWEDSSDRRSWTELGKFPFVVAIHYYRDDTHWRNVHCTGTLIGPRKVLTAAHCLRNPYADPPAWYEPTDLQVAAGVVDGDIDELYEEGVQRAQSRKLVPYHGFESSNFERYDVGIILLGSSIVPARPWFHDPDFEYYINYATLPEKPSDPLPDQAKDARAQFYAVGFGIDRKNGSESRRLRFDRAEAVIPENDECKERYSKEWSKTALCVKNPRQKTPESPKGLSCPGDSGGPLVQAVASGSHTHVWGVAVMGAKNPGEKCSAGPSLYEKLPFFISWISTTN